jgi:lipopolysaccharide/colanic/teichoic acid biosynthesis glycosyltransferase
MLTYNTTIKNLLDILISVAAIMVLSLFIIVIGIFIKLDSNGPVFFKQQRIGWNLKPFRLFKFRTMTNESKHGQGQFEPGKTRRVTRIGAFLRKSKLDELPELFNILKGEMSIVGPRPEVKKYVDIYKKDFKKTLIVRPGLTDFASIKYCDEETVLSRQPNPETYYLEKILPDKMRLARQYVKQISFRTDFLIIKETIKTVFKKLI